MALKKLIFKPGINRDTTNYAQGSGSPDGQGGWYAGNKIRFLSGFPQKLGGWKLYSTGAMFAGVARALFNWSRDAYNLLAVGTNTNVFVESEGTYYNITPIRATFGSTASDNCFSTVSDAVIDAHPTWIKVTLAGAYANAGDTVIFFGAVGFAGIPAGTLNAAHIVLEDLDLLAYSANSFYIEVGIPPTPALANCFSTVVDATITAHPTWIKVLLSGAYANPSGTVIFSGAVGFAAIPTGTLNAAHIVLQGATYDPDFFYIDVGLVPTPALTGGGTATTAEFIGGGTGITAEFEVGIGSNVAYSGGGWGAPSWGGSVESPQLGWGIGSLTPIFLPIRLMYFDKYANNLFFNYRYGGPNSTLHSVPQSMYVWTFPTNAAPPLTTRAVAISDLATAEASPYFTGTDVPPSVTQMLFDDNSNTLMAFGCNPYDATLQPVDPLLIRWASQDNYLNWAPSDDAGISTAGYLRIQSGSNILQAVSNAKEILVFTESSITSVQYTYSYPNLFSQTLISADISLFAPRAVVAINNNLFWMGRDKFYTYNGRVEPLDCTLTLHVFNNLNFSQSDQCFAMHGEQFLEVWWFYCSGTSNVINSYVVYRYDDNIWYYGDCADGFVRTTWSDSPLRPFPQGAEPSVVDGVYTGTSRLYNHESGVDSGVLPLPSYIQSADIDLPESGEHFVLVKRIIPDMSFDGSEGLPTVYFTVAPRNFPGAPYMTENQENEVFPRRVNLQSTVALDQYTEQVFVRARARQMAIAVSSDAIGVNWSLGAVRADVVPDGRRGIGPPPGILLVGRCVNGADTCVGAVSTFYQGLTVVGVEASGVVGFVGDNGPVIPNLMVGGVKAIGGIGTVTAATVVLPATPLLRLDADDIVSYPGTGDIWYDISGNGYDTSLNSNTVYDVGAISGAPAMQFANPLRQLASGTAIVGTAGEITCSALATPVYVGSMVQVSGTPIGTGAIDGYSPPATTYFVYATNGSTSFTLSTTLGGAPVTTTAGTTTGLVFHITANSYARVPTAMIETLSINSGVTPTQIDKAYTFDVWVKFSDLSPFVPLTGTGSLEPNSALILDGAITTTPTNNIVRIGSVDGGSYLRAGLTQFSGTYGQIDSTTGPWAPVVNRWYNLTMVNTAGLSQTSDAIKLYVDGVLVSSGRAYSALNPTNITGLLRSANGSNWLTIGANSYTGSVSQYTYLSQSIIGWIPVVNGYARELTALEIQDSYTYYSSRFTNPALPVPATTLYGTPIALYDTAITDYGQYGSYAVGGSLFTPTFKYDGNGTYPITGGLINQVDYLTTTPVTLNVTGIGSPGLSTSGKITYSSIAVQYPSGLPPMTPIVVTGTTSNGSISPTYVSGSVWWTGYNNYSASGVTPTTTSVIISPNGPKEYSFPFSSANSPGYGPLDSTAGTLTGLIFTAYPNTNPLNANGVAGFYGAYIDNSTGLLPPTLTSARPLEVFGLGDSRLTLFPSTNLQNILINRSAFSVNVWYRHTSFATYGAVIAQYFGANYYWPSVGDSDIGMFIGNVTGASNLVSAGIWNRAAGGGAGVWASTNTVTQVVDTWYNYTMTFSGGAGTITFYCNGVSIGTAAVSGTITQPTPVNPIAVTRNYNNGTSVAYPGKLGALQIYDVELTGAQVTQNWEHFRTRYGV